MTDRTVTRAAIPAATQDATQDVTRAAATRTEDLHELLQSFIQLKSWLRDVQHWRHWQDSDSASAPLATLATLDRCGPARVSRLAETTRLDLSVVSRQAAALEKAGLITREPDPVDGRAHVLSLTAAGAETLTRARSRLADHLSAQLTEWSADELHALSAGLRRLVADLSAAPFPDPTSSTAPSAQSSPSSPSPTSPHHHEEALDV